MISARRGERPHRRTLPADAGEQAFRRPVVVAAVGPPLERVDVVGARLDDLAERPAAARPPRRPCWPSATRQPPAVQHRVQGPERARLPHVHVFVVGDRAGAACAGEIAAAGDHVAERRGEALSELEAAPVHVAVVAPAELVVEPGSPRTMPTVLATNAPAVVANAHVESRTNPPTPTGERQSYVPRHPHTVPLIPAMAPSGIDSPNGAPASAPSEAPPAVIAASAMWRPASAVGAGRRGHRSRSFASSRRISR